MLPHGTDSPPGTAASCCSPGKHHHQKCTCHGSSSFLSLTGQLGLTLPQWRSVAPVILTLSSCGQRDSSDSSLGLTWASSTGSHLAFCKEELPVSSYSFKVTSHNFVHRSFFQRKALASIVSSLPPLLGPQDFCMPLCARAQLQQEEGPPQPYPSPTGPVQSGGGGRQMYPASGITPTSVCARSRCAG